MTLNIPKKSDGTLYDIEGLFEDQLTVVLLIMDKILEWALCEDLSDFKPLRVTINGPAGTGKTVVINTIVTLIRSMFNANGVVQVCAPTGTAAFNAGGETLHHFLANKAGMRQYDAFSMSAKKKKDLTLKLKNLLCLIIDERSLLDSTHLGIAEQMVSETIFNGEMSDKSWGNLPVLILVGDDYQLPGVAPGAFDAFEPPKGHKATDRGRYVFKECATVVVSLSTSKRIQDKQIADKELLTKLRTATPLDDNEVHRLLNLHLDKIQQKHGPAVIHQIHKDCIYLFYRNNPRILKNLEILVNNCSPVNPVAVCKTRSSGLHSGMAITSHFKNSKIPTSSLLSIGTKVAIENKNFCPIWGLHNGAVGIVDEIIFQPGHNPNKGDLPHYVVVNFPQYVGPKWDLDNPTVSYIKYSTKIHNIQSKSYSSFQKHVPIPTASYRCDKNCCLRTYVPLDVSYARTIHKFQGLTAGPVDEGKIPNMYQCIVCDPDEKKFEGTSLGLFYTATSRATTLGDDNGLNSAIYFSGSAFNEQRIRGLTKLKNSDQDFIMAKKRKKWVDFIKRRERMSKAYISKATKKKDETIATIKSTTFDLEFLYTRIRNHSQLHS